MHPLTGLALMQTHDRPAWDDLVTVFGEAAVAAACRRCPTLPAPISLVRAALVDQVRTTARPCSSEASASREPQDRRQRTPAHPHARPIRPVERRRSPRPRVPQPARRTRPRHETYILLPVHRLTPARLAALRQLVAHWSA
jgi:hypothetical protein